MQKTFAIIALLFLIGCSDDGAVGIGDNNWNPTDDAGAGDASPCTPGTCPVGASCSANSDCATEICVVDTCAADTPNEVLCGNVYCATGQTCDSTTNTCLPDTTPQECNDGEEWRDGQCESLCGGTETYCPDDADGFACCDSGTGCVFEKCVDLGAACDDDNPCPFTQFCEPTLGFCVDASEDPNACIFAPPVGEFDPIEAFAWTGSSDSPTFDQVMMMPVVANLTDDNNDGLVDENDIPDIIFTTFAGSGYTSPGVLRVISGADGTEHFSSTTLADPFEVYGSAIPAVGDIDEDGAPEIVVESGLSGIFYALDNDGSIKWTVSGLSSTRHGGPAIANIDSAGPPEIVTSSHVLSASGDRICDFAESTLVPAIADLDLDGVQEILVGDAIYTFDNPSATDGSGCSGYSAGVGGFTAVANLDADNTPEIVVARDGALALLEHDGTEVWRFDLPLDQPRIQSIFGIADCSPSGTCSSNAQCGGGRAICWRGQCIPNKACQPGGGPPTIADFDGDREPEIGIAGRWYYMVFEADGTPVWAHKTNDYSSAVTGSSVFDFEGDGRAEVVYNDEQFLRVYSGAGSGADADGDDYDDPEILLEVANSSGTLLEYPLIVDVDNDGSAEIVVMANNYSTPGSTTTGIRVLKDSANNWVGTRRIWNQHTYHVTNVNEDATIPLAEAPNWLLGYLNNYRQNAQGGNPLLAPNLVPTIDDVDGQQCAVGGLVVRFTVQNAGSIGVRAGALDTSVFAGPAGGELQLVETVTNQIPLAPGASEAYEVTWQPPETLFGQQIDVRVVTDLDGAGESRHNECIEDDNQVVQGPTLCDVAQ
jgi:hypothetical protein